MRLLILSAVLLWYTGNFYTIPQCFFFPRNPSSVYHIWQFVALNCPFRNYLKKTIHQPFSWRLQGNFTVNNSCHVMTWCHGTIFFITERFWGNPSVICGFLTRTEQNGQRTRNSGFWSCILLFEASRWTNCLIVGNLRWHSHGFIGQVQLGVRYVIILLYVQFWIRLAAVSYHGKKVRTVVFPMVRSVNTPRDTRNCVKNEPEYAICVIFTTRLYHKTLGIILCAMIWQIRHNYNRLDDFHCDVTGHSKMSALGTAGAMVKTHENSLMMRSCKGPKLFSVL